MCADAERLQGAEHVFRMLAKPIDMTCVMAGSRSGTASCFHAKPWPIQTNYVDRFQNGTTVSRYEVLLIRAGLVYLVLTGALGVAFFAYPTLAVAFRTTHIHLGVLGFFLSMVMGVAYWLMPRPGGLRQERSEAWTFWLLNAGLLLRTLLEPWSRLGGPEWLQVGSIVAGLALLAAIVVFAVAMWSRVVTAEEIHRIRGVQRAQDG